MKKEEKIIITAAAIVIAVYIIYGLFCLELPSYLPDENWAIQIIRSWRYAHEMNDPSQPREISPFYYAFYHATPLNQLPGILQVSFNVLLQWAGASENNSIRIASFVYSALMLVLTYLLARQFRLSKMAALLAVIILICTPEFFTQLHSNRPEILLGCCLLLFVLLLKKILELKEGRRRKIKLSLLALFSWLPAIIIHPSGMLIPPVIGIIYLLAVRKKIVTVETLLLSVFFLPGCTLYLYVFANIGAHAEMLGGGNYYNTQGPPILKGINHLIKVPLIFYNRLSSFNFLSRPLSLVVLLSGLSAILFSIKRKTELSAAMYFIIPCIVVSMFVLLLLSGSLGKYNVIMFPFLVISIVSALFYFSEKYNQRRILLPACFIFLLLMLATNFYGMKAQAEYMRNYKTLLAQVRQSIPENVPVLGWNFYSPAFPHQQLYHNSWMNEDAGVKGISFEQAVHAIHAKYIIVDDSFIGRAVGGGRSKTWMDDMMNYLATQCTLEKTFTTYYKLGSRVPDPQRYPDDWKYSGLKKGFLQKVCIYKVKG
jgi:hypothetical protein